jgi:cell division protease FtsH
MPNRFSKSLLGWVILIGLGLVLLAFLSKNLEGSRREISTTDFWTYVENGQVTGKILIRDDRIEGELSEGLPGVKPNERKFFVTFNRQGEQNFDERLRAALAKHNNPARPYYKYDGWWEGMAANMLVLLLVFFLIWFLVFRRLGNAAGGGGFLGSFGRSRHRVLTREHTRVTFDDVAGIEEAKEEVREIIEFLRNPRKFQRLGGRIPRGVLLVGEPGCGKTLLAKAIAGEADVPFFSISGSDFVEMFVGVGASRVRDLFKQAKDSSPCIIFLDEIDAVGRRRGVGFNGGGHDEREQTLNAILVEMDGFDSSDQVIVIAATNRVDVLDPALTRPGRFDRQINVPLPDLNGRLQILKIYISKVKAGPDVDLHRLARGTPMFSGADLAALVNEAAIAATMGNKEFVEQIDLEEARDKVRWGRARKSRVIDEQEKQVTAYHEAGHAMVQLLTPNADPLHKVSIIPRGSMGGATFSLPEKDRYLYTRSYCKAMLCVALGGRLAEEIFCHDVSSGASSDIAHATEVAKRMVLDWGMSERLGFVRYSTDERRMLMPEMGGKEYSDRTAEVIDQEIKAIIDEAYATTRQILESRRDQLERLAAALLKYETLTGEEAKAIIDGKEVDKPTLGDLLDREQAKNRPGVTISPTPPEPSPGAPPLPSPG